MIREVTTAVVLTRIGRQQPEAADGATPVDEVVPTSRRAGGGRGRCERCEPDERALLAALYFGEQTMHEYAAAIGVTSARCRGGTARALRQAGGVVRGAAAVSGAGLRDMVSRGMRGWSVRRRAGAHALGAKSDKRALYGDPGLVPTRAGRAGARGAGARGERGGRAAGAGGGAGAGGRGAAAHAGRSGGGRDRGRGGAGRGEVVRIAEGVLGPWSAGGCGRAEAAAGAGREERRRHRASPGRRGAALAAGAGAGRARGVGGGLHRAPATAPHVAAETAWAVAGLACLYAVGR
jgi:hypothetical protein